MRSLARGLSVLRHLNEHGPSTVVEIAAETGISRPAVYRVLGELCRLEYVRKRDRYDGYEITHQVRRLADGFSDEAWVREIASPILRDLQQQIIWPTDLGTLFGNAMYLRETTRQHSPFTIDSALVGLRLPLLFSATGRAYLAFCPQEERSRLLAELGRSSDPFDAIAKDTRWVNKLLGAVRKNGYGHRFGDFMPETGAIAVPIMHRERVLACLNITFIASALSPAEAARRYLAAMKKSAHSLSDAVSAQLGSDLRELSATMPPRQRRGLRKSHTASIAQPPQRAIL